MVLRLLSVRWLSARNALTRSAPSDRRRAWLNLLWTPVVLLFVGTLSYQFFDPFVALAYRYEGMIVVLERLPAFALFASTWMLFLSGVTVGIHMLYLNQELPLLLAAPLHTRSVFFAKFAEAVTANAALFLTIGGPVLLAYGFATGAVSPPFLLYLVAILVAIAALPTGLGVLASVVMMRVLPANRTREILAAIGIALFACVYFALSVSVPRLADEGDSMRGAMQRMVDVMQAPLLARGPWAWGGEVLNGQAEGAQAWGKIGLLWFAAAAAVFATAQAAQWFHGKGWSTAQESPQAAEVKTRAGRWERRLSFIPGPMRAVLMKDLRTLSRDMRQLSMFFIPIAVVAVFLVNVQQQPRIAALPGPLVALTLYPILAMISLRLAVSGFVMENRAMWMMAAAPNDPATILMGKFLYSFSLSLPLTAVTTALYGLIRETSGAEWLVNLALVFCAVGGFCGIGVGSSVMFADFKEESARFGLSAGARALTFVLQMAFLLVVFLVSAFSWFLVARMEYAPGPIYLAAALLLLAVSTAFIAGPLLIGARRLRNLEW
jgi:ABC-2 type transport system permease protein